MALVDLPSDSTVIGGIEISLYMHGEGIGTAFGYEGVTKEAAIGYLTVVLDRLREERRLEWDTCPECGRPWSEHFDDDSEEDDPD